MNTKIDKRDRAHLFRSRLEEAMTRAGSNQSALSRDIGVDRSTVSQLLSGSGARLPNAQVVAECARALGVSADWLLGLSDRPESAAHIVANAFHITKAPRALVDEQIFDWHREADGYKIRHVPTALPDMLKTRAVLSWEFTPHLGRTAEQAITASNERLDWMRDSASDYEMAVPLYEIDSFARATGYYAGLALDVRLEQLERLQRLTRQLYPRLRMSLFDARRLYSAPLTIFGPLQAVIYLGSNYLTFRHVDRVRAITTHFDHLVREASVPARDISDHIGQLLTEVQG
ncbi:helix-turn-helix transcriptional regulator [Marinovum sp. 2_MG-2023]|uniref:helix-turn-helix domain-containing protein n=1 Tax=unclassified Marinovum TaxID=2647166 RepID=UPI0026E2A380|nr:MULTISPECIES: helix-turn-helix transcriptional regulator [unclassified Marinovum]MDO6728756.1 helix-turn-helix transcriptional regulator [Marinovum sp. 2_MG-2023]MDO6777828.1 helix-turn-helix transcriptional regulator [Marinovum sp. 1_MG-2023]